MDLNDYKFLLWTCASSENEVTGEDIELEETFECDLKGMNLKPGDRLFSPKIEKSSSGFESTIYPDFNFTVISISENSIVLKRSFMYSSSESRFEIGFDNPERREGFSFGRYTYDFKLTLEKR